ncbi:MAG: glycosyltransferase [Dictyoglomus thermophilum]|nr:glycosyltransferase [Dictyoglomus thermophilum]MCX7719942.1 glycosyltransferase [Dictyoglomus thermophilum]
MKKALASGGVIINKRSKEIFLLKKKNGNWVLPKGHVEEGENPEETAIREVKEETGLNVKIIDYIGKTYYFAPATEKHPEEEKTVIWFLMETEEEHIKVEEDTFLEGRFFNFREAYNFLTFDQEREILRRAYDLYLIRNKEKKLHILMLTWEYPPRIVGGLSRHVYDLSKHLAKQNIKVSVITCEAPDTPFEEHFDNLSIYRVPEKLIDSYNFISWIYLLNISMIVRAMEVNKKEPIDIIHSHDWLTTFSAYTLKHTLKKPLISTIHATEYGRNQGIYTDEQRFIHNVEWWLTYESWKVIVCSLNMKEEVKHLFSLPEDKIIVLPNGIDTENLRTTIDVEELRKIYAPNGEKIILFIGRMHPQKGAEYLLRSIPIVLQKFQNVKFIFVGTGPQLNSLIEESKYLGINERVIFTGFIDDNLRNALLNIADICVFPSIYEPFGIVALEAMALGKPVIASNLGGFAEIIEDGKDGILFEPRNVQNLAEKIIWALTNEDHIQIIKNNAIKKVKEKYLWEKIAEETKNLYFKVYTEYLKTDW